MGNGWVVEVQPNAGLWGPILYLCHDPSVVVYQADSLSAFLHALLVAHGSDMLVEYVCKDAAFVIWSGDPFCSRASQAKTSTDPVLAAFAQEQPDSWRIADLRTRVVGSGFRLTEPAAKIRRYGSDLLFAIEDSEPRGLLQKLLRR